LQGTVDRRSRKRQTGRKTGGGEERKKPGKLLAGLISFSGTARNPMRSISTGSMRRGWKFGGMASKEPMEIEWGWG
jgi:hypothetical protein